ncbi:hypothetical protein J4558_00175 [Leptolyngbya sp. 15MV]|nr:hypothetical protein J4558_00175 [Leptolyngbya sp. 15MV]
MIIIIETGCHNPPYARLLGGTERRFETIGAAAEYLHELDVDLLRSPQGSLTRALNWVRRVSIDDTRVTLPVPGSGSREARIAFYADALAEAARAGG